jgi:hypothetical protein
MARRRWEDPVDTCPLTKIVYYLVQSWNHMLDIHYYKLQLQLDSALDGHYITFFSRQRHQTKRELPGLRMIRSCVCPVLACALGLECGRLYNECTFLQC